VLIQYRAWDKFNCIPAIAERGSGFGMLIISLRAMFQKDARPLHTFVAWLRLMGKGYIGVRIFAVLVLALTMMLFGA